MSQADKTPTTIASSLVAASATVAAPLAAARSHPLEIIDPRSIKERFYGLILSGDCLDPVFKHGDQIVVDQEAALQAGDFAVFYHRPEVVPDGCLPRSLKRLLTAVPDFVTFPWKDHPNSEVIPVVVVEQLNPVRRWTVRCRDLLAVHKCLGRYDDAHVWNQLEAAR